LIFGTDIYKFPISSVIWSKKKNHMIDDSENGQMSSDYLASPTYTS